MKTFTSLTFSPHTSEKMLGALRSCPRCVGWHAGVPLHDAECNELAATSLLLLHLLVQQHQQ